MRFTSLPILASFLLSANSVFAAPAPAAANDNEAFVAENIAGRYIVSYKTETFGARSSEKLASIDALESSKGYSTQNGYRKIQMDGGAFRALSGKFTEAEIEALRRNPLVGEIEQEQIYRPVVMAAPVSEFASDIRIQKEATWGLARLSHLGTGPWNNFSYLNCNVTTYSYVVDTGIFIEHEDFEGRATWGTNTIDKIDKDEDSHGTHVTGTIIGKTWGVAKNGKAIAVKVLGANGGSTTTVMAGMVWAYNDAKAKGRLAVSSINASLGGGYSKALNEVFSQIHNNGLYVTVAAGNDGHDANFNSPASANNITVVSAIDTTDTRAYFGNYGNRITIFAPGLNIRSASILGKSASSLKSGTSMASPHVAGLAAYYQCVYGVRSNKEVNARLQKCAAKGYVKDGKSPKAVENVALNCFANSGGTVGTKNGAIVESD